MFHGPPFLTGDVDKDLGLSSFFPCRGLSPSLQPSTPIFPLLPGEGNSLPDSRLMPLLPPPTNPNYDPDRSLSPQTLPPPLAPDFSPPSKGLYPSPPLPDVQSMIVTTAARDTVLLAELFFSRCLYDFLRSVDFSPVREAPGKSSLSFLTHQPPRCT